MTNDGQMSLGLLDYGCLYEIIFMTAIALFTVSFSHLHYNVIQHGCEAASS